MLLFPLEDAGCCAELAEEVDEDGGGSFILPLAVDGLDGNEVCLFGGLRRVAAGSAFVDFDAAAKGRKPPESSSSSSSTSPSEPTSSIGGFLLTGARLNA